MQRTTDQASSQVQGNSTLYRQGTGISSFFSPPNDDGVSLTQVDDFHSSPARDITEKARIMTSRSMDRAPSQNTVRDERRLTEITYNPAIATGNSTDWVDFAPQLHDAGAPWDFEGNTQSRFPDDLNGIIGTDVNHSLEFFFPTTLPVSPHRAQQGQGGTWHDASVHDAGGPSTSFEPASEAAVTSTSEDNMTLLSSGTPTFWGQQ